MTTKLIGFLDWTGKKELEDISSQESTPFLKNLVFTITDRCPSWCTYCYNAKNVPGAVEGQSFSAAKNELSPDEILKLIQEAIPIGLEGVQLSGGEPLLRLKDLLLVLRFVKGHEIQSTIYTNGYLITENTAKDLATSGLTRARVSLAGASYDKHSMERKDPGGDKAFTKIVNAIKYLLSEGIETGIFTPITKTSVRNIEDIVELAELLGVASVTFHNYIPSGISVQDIPAMLSTDEHYAAVERIISIRREHTKVRVISDYGLFEFLSRNWEGIEVYPAPCGRTRLGVHADGWISTCVCTSKKLADTRQQGFSLSDFWQTNPVIMRIRKATPLGICKNCIRWAVCQGGCISYNDNLGHIEPVACPAVKEYMRKYSSVINCNVLAESILRHDFMPENE